MCLDVIPWPLIDEIMIVGLRKKCCLENKTELTHPAGFYFGEKDAGKFIGKVCFSVGKVEIGVFHLFKSALPLKRYHIQNSSIWTT